MRLEDTVVVVTGASRGLGEAMAGAFVAEGATVVCAARHEDELTDAVAGMTGPGSAIAVPTDVRRWSDVQYLFEAAHDENGHVDVLVNNAGVQQVTAGGERREPVVDVPVDVWDDVIDTNLRGAFLCAKAALEGMLERDAGRLMHVSSGSGESGRANCSPYVASKHGLEGLAACLALELEATGVSSFVMRPPGGGIYTESRAHRAMSTFAHESAQVVAEPAVQLVAGAGVNGGRYIGTDDGTGFEEAPRA